MELLFGPGGNESASISPWQKGEGSRGACLLTFIMWECAADLICPQLWAVTHPGRVALEQRGQERDQSSSLAGHLMLSALEKHKTVAENSSHFIVLIQQITCVCETCVCVLHKTHPSGLKCASMVKPF